MGKRIEMPPGSTGGTFSVGYIVTGLRGEPGFLKALDFARVFGRPDTMKIIQALVDNYNFEQELSYDCRDCRMTRVVHPLDHGMVSVDDKGFQVPDVYYIIYEMADGDSRWALALLGEGAVEWKLRALHDVATGLRQLHSAGVAHQDVKPSNVMCFDDGDSKIGDLGQASRRDRPRDLDGFPQPGDPVYAPPEQWYGEVLPDWTRRRFGCDAYHLGSLALFFFSGASVTQAIADRLRREHRPDVWAGDYGMVLPFVVDAWDQVMAEAEAQLAGELPTLGRDIVLITRQLTHPDPDRRGHPKALGSGNPYSLDRYITKLDLLHRQAERERI